MNDDRSCRVYWCPRCQIQSARQWHFCERGNPMFPQTDVETRCDEIDAVPVAEVQRLRAALREIRDMRGPNAAERAHQMHDRAKAALNSEEAA